MRGARLRVPPFVNVYGPSGVGKTAETGRCLSAGTILAAPGATVSITTTWGVTPKVEYVKTIEEATKFIESEAKKTPANRVSGIGVDDFSAMSENTVSIMEKRYSGWAIWNAVRDVVISFRDAARYAGIALVVNSWEQPPKTRNKGGTSYVLPGGPKLPMDLPEQLPAMADVNLRAKKVDKGIYGLRERVYDGTDPQYVQKDRGNIATGNVVPMNLAEILRCAGWDIPRCAELGWVEEAIAACFKLLERHPDNETQVFQEVYTQLLAGGADPRHARWATQDAWDRHTLRTMLAQRYTTFV